MNAVILLLAGQSQRLNAGIKKQFFLINEKPLFLHAFETFYKTDKFDKFILVISKEDEITVKDFMYDYKNNQNIDIIFGGDTRKKSVYNALVHLKSELKENDNILIHDAARVLVSEELILNILEELKTSDAVVPAINVVDSMVQNIEENIKTYVPRENYKLIQTPQGFKFGGILNAHEVFKYKNFTDDASLILNMNQPVKIINGDRFNLKVTTKEDLEIVKCILEARK